MSEICTPAKVRTTSRNDGANREAEQRHHVEQRPGDDERACAVPANRRCDLDPYCAMMENTAPLPPSIAVAVPIRSTGAKRAICPCIAAPSSAAQCISQANQKTESDARLSLLIGLFRHATSSHVRDVGDPVAIHGKRRMSTADHRDTCRAIRRSGVCSTSASCTFPSTYRASTSTPSKRCHGQLALACAKTATDERCIAQRRGHVHETYASSRPLRVFRREQNDCGLQGTWRGIHRARTRDKRSPHRGRHARGEVIHVLALDKWQIRGAHDRAARMACSQPGQHVLLAGWPLVNPLVHVRHADRSSRGPTTMTRPAAGDAFIASTIRRSGVVSSTVRSAFSSTPAIAASRGRNRPAAKMTTSAGSIRLG